jgi:hypothetical protein
MIYERDAMTPLCLAEVRPYFPPNPNPTQTHANCVSVSDSRRGCCAAGVPSGRPAFSGEAQQSAPQLGSARRGVRWVRSLMRDVWSVLSGGLFR